MTENIPLVSVIIPMYNAEKFIVQTLESLCRQTMKDFEVVIVDDCSTDNSLQVVRNFAPRLVGSGIKVNGIRLSTNTGMPYLPRNVAINFSRGKYLAFLDNDDFFTPTALEELTTLAEEFQADVINMPEVFYVEDNGSTDKELLNPANYKIRNCRNFRLNRVAKPTVVSNDLSERVKLWLNNEFHWATWASFCKRDFWISNQIEFPYMPVSDDTLANFYILCLAKKILLVPNITYIQRDRTDSISHEIGDMEKFVHKWLSNLILGFKAFDEFMKRIPFFIERQDFRYAVFDWYFNRGISDARYFPSAYEQVHHAALNHFVEKEFSGDDAIFAAYLFNTVNLQRIQLIRLQIELNEAKKNLQQQ